MTWLVLGGVLFIIGLALCVYEWLGRRGSKESLYFFGWTAKIGMGIGFTGILIMSFYIDSLHMF